MKRDKTTIETKVAAAIAAIFMVLTFGVVAQEDSRTGTQQLGQKTSTMPSELSNVNQSGRVTSFSERKSIQKTSLDGSKSGPDIVAAEIVASDR